MKVLFVEAEETFYMPVNTKIPKRWAYLAEIATYVSKNGNEVKIMDCLSPKISHAEILEEITKNKYDLICFLIRIETVNSLLKLVPLVSKISKQTKLLAYGDATCMFPNFIKKNLRDLDAIIESGDWEVAICNYIKYLKNEDFLDNSIPGITLKIDNKWINATRCNGENFTEWNFPDLDSNLIDIDLYKQLRHNEVTISASRGCPYNCKFCLAVKTFDKDDRRKDINELVEYMVQNKNKVETYKLFSPTFTYDEKWVENFCDKLIETGENINWVTTSRTDKLQNEKMICKMSKSGCKKIAVGIETLDIEANRELKKFKDLNHYKKSVENMFNIANKYNVEIKPLLMMGIKGQTRSNLKESLSFLKKVGAKEIRIAAYSPRQILTQKDNDGTLTIDDINSMDKMTYINYMPDGMDESLFLELIYGTEEYRKNL